MFAEYRLSTSQSPAAAAAGRKKMPVRIKKLRKPHVTANAPPQKTRVLGIAAVAALFFYVLYHMTSSNSENSWYSDHSGGANSVSNRCPPAEFVVALAKHATPDKFIVLALVDTAFADMALNLYESSLRPNGITNFLFVGAGWRACEILRNASLPCYHYIEDKDTDVASIYKSPEFIRKMNIRTDMILDALSVGFTVLHTDLDVVFLRNPVPDLKVVMLSADIAMMWDSVAHNAGFVVIRPTWFARNVYERMKRITTYSLKTDDQTALNQAIYTMNRLYKRRGFNAVTLDSKKYLCGVDYFEKGHRVFPTDANCTECAVVHNNWIVSREAKIYRFKEHLMWMYDKDEYYSSSSKNYLVYQNPFIWPTVDASDREELASLRAALALGQLLDRAVVLPRFHCSLTGGGLGGLPPSSSASSSATSRWTVSASGRYRRRPVHRPQGPPTTPPPSDPDRECPLNGLLNVTAFETEFGGRYRENSFLRHPYVPEVVRLDQSGYISLHVLLRAEVTGDASAPQSSSAVPTSSLYGNQSTTVSTASTSQSVVVPDRIDRLPSDPVKLSASSAVKLLGGIASRVLHIHSLYRLDLRFDNDDHQSQFDSKIRRAFQRSSYRQL